MTSLTGPIIRKGKSVTGIVYSESVLVDLVDKFNKKYKGGGALGQISKVYPINPHFDHNYLSHVIKEVKYDYEMEAVIADIEFIDNDKGKHLIKLFSHVPDEVKLCPVVNGQTDEDNNAVVAELIRVDFFYNKNIDR